MTDLKSKKPIQIKLNQRTVTRVVRHLVEQRWKQSVDTDRDTCVYYDGKTGMRCAVGWAMSEQSAKFVTRTEPYACVSTLFVHVIDCDKPDALRELQEAHDQGDRPREMRKRVKQWCERWGFEFKEPLKACGGVRESPDE
jgi:hypothetical protein